MTIIRILIKSTTLCHKIHFFFNKFIGQKLPHELIRNFWTGDHMNAQSQSSVQFEIKLYIYTHIFY